MPTPNVLRPLVLEYRVAGSLDGVTPSEAVPLPPQIGSPVVPTENKVVIEVPGNLGLIDLTGLPGLQGQYADRIIKWLAIYGPNFPTTTDNVGVAFDGISEGTDLTIPPVANGIRSYNCLFVPQSAQLRVNGMAGSPGNPVVVRLGIWQPSSLLELNEMFQACCCLDGAIDSLGQPFFTQAIFVAGACERTISSSNPPTRAQGDGATMITLGGTNFTDSDVVAIVHQGGTALIEITNVIAVTEFQMIVQINVPADQQLGAYDITVAAPLGGPGCSATLDGGLTITV